MVNRRGTKFSLAAEQESVNFFLKSENQSLKKKNEELAKALTETKIEHQKLMQSSLELHERLYSADVERIKFKEFIKALNLEMRDYIQHFFSLTEQMTNMINKMNMVIQSPNALDQYTDNSNSSINLSNASNQSHKTMAVMPMVSGHTILSPKINLPRVSVRQLADMVNNSSNGHISDNDMEADEIEFSDNVSANNEDLSGGNSRIDNGIPNQRLDTMREEGEDEDEDEDEEQEQNNISTAQPLLSGVFKDIRVYISPMSSQHLIKFKNKTPRKFNNRSLTHNNNNSSLSMTNAHNSSSNRTLTRKDDVSEPSTSGSLSVSNNGTQLKETINYAPVSINNVSKTTEEDYDPMEGTSNSWTNTQDVDAKFKGIPNETSTPYTPSTNFNKSSCNTDKSGTPRRPSRNVARRKGTNAKSKNTNTSSTKLSNCSVRLQKMSPNTLRSHASSNTSVSPRKSREFTRNSNKERDDSPTVLEKSRRSSTQLTDNGRKRRSTDLSYSSPKPRRRRNVRAVTYKEPSLAKKMRR